jgi:hypothetical protein
MVAMGVGLQNVRDLINPQRSQTRLGYGTARRAPSIDHHGVAPGLDYPDVPDIGMFTARHAATLKNRQTGYDLSEWCR